MTDGAWPIDHLPSRRILLRGARLRCARCGSAGLFRRWVSMVDRCPRCDLHFEREEGYWTGAMLINLAVTEAAFLVAFVGALVLSWPDPDWVAVLVFVLAVSVVVPVVFYPFSKTIWVAGDLAFRKLDGTPI